VVIYGDKPSVWICFDFYWEVKSKLWRSKMTTAKGDKIGYARVSTNGQKIDSQVDALYHFGCIKVFCDKTSGVKKERPGFHHLMDYLRTGDLLVVTELSRMTRSLKHLLQVVEDLEKLGVGLISLRENIDTSTATGRCFISIIGAIAQMEQELKSERTAAGREAAKARGRTGGRPRTDPKKLEQARILYENSTQTAAEVCKAVGVGRRTFFSYLKMKREQIAEMTEENS
jgi:DNA invertase Pin-like site-specific DNA recombinase